MDSSGNCTSSFVADFNEVELDRQAAARYLDSTFYTDLQKREKVRELQSSCQSFFAKHAGTTCRAESKGQEKMASSNDLKAVCDAADEYLSKTNAAPAPAPAPQGDELSDYPYSRLKLSVLDQAQFQDFVLRTDLNMANGRKGPMQDFAQYVNREGGTVCFMVATSEGKKQAESWKPSDSLETSSRMEESLAEGYRKLLIGFNDDKIGLTCLKKGSSPYTVEDVRKATKDYFTFRITL